MAVLGVSDGVVAVLLAAAYAVALLAFLTIWRARARASPGRRDQVTEISPPGPPERPAGGRQHEQPLAAAVRPHRGGPASEADAAVALPAAERAASETASECEIAVWHGIFRAQFYAAPIAPSSDAEAVALHASPLFRASPEQMLERTEEAEAAHNYLVEALVREGWEVAGDAGPWYATRFRRRTEPT
jgi:hypothetical protein